MSKLNAHYLQKLGEEEINTGAMIVYTSADSVLQICGNEETMGVPELYRCCEIARELTMRDEWRVGRVIARPHIPPDFSCVPIGHRNPRDSQSRVP